MNENTQIVEEIITHKEYLLLHLKGVLMQGSDAKISIYENTNKFFQVAQIIY